MAKRQHELRTITDVVPWMVVQQTYGASSWYIVIPTPRPELWFLMTITKHPSKSHRPPRVFRITKSWITNYSKEVVLD